MLDVEGLGMKLEMPVLLVIRIMITIAVSERRECID